MLCIQKNVISSILLNIKIFILTLSLKIISFFTWNLASLSLASFSHRIEKSREEHENQACCAPEWVPLEAKPKTTNQAMSNSTKISVGTGLYEQHRTQRRGSITDKMSQWAHQKN